MNKEQINNMNNILKDDSSDDESENEAVCF
jgi:hypothetical protein